MGGLHEIDGRSVANDVLNMFVPVCVCVCLCVMCIYNT